MIPEMLAIYLGFSIKKHFKKTFGHNLTEVIYLTFVAHSATLVHFLKNCEKRQHLLEAMSQYCSPLCHSSSSSSLKPLQSVVPQQLFDQPEGANEAGSHGEGGDVVRFGEGPVVGGKGPRQRALSQGNDKVDAPEESHGVVDLQVEEVPQEEALVIVLEEYAAGRGAIGVIRGVEGLTE